MPAKVDAEDRRRRLVLAAAELIADEGINALTNGKIANRLSGSTTMVTHYFRSKRELVLDTYQTMASRSRARLEQAMRESDDPLAACLHALLPLDDSTRLEWKVWLAYQGMSVGDPELTQIWASRTASAVDRVTRLIEADISAGRMSSSIDPDMESGRLFALIQGMSFQSIVDPERWSPAHLRRIVDLELLRLRRIDNGLRAAPGAELADFTVRASRPRARARVERLLRNERHLGDDPSPDLARLAQQIVALTLGIALQAVFEPASTTSVPQRALLADGLARLAATRSPRT